jgi:hypothetical protein
MATAEQTKAPILSVMFIHESGYVESYRPDEIRADPATFRTIMASHMDEGRKPLVMRQRPLAAGTVPA